MSARQQGPSALAVLLGAIDEAFDRKAWHGTNFRGALRGVDATIAAWRPAPGRHNIWEITLHAAYWKYAVRRRLTGEPRGGFPLAGANFWRRPEGAPSAAAWQADRRLLDAMHRALREVVAALPIARLDQRCGAKGHTCRRTIAGVALHDVYHAGQVQLLKHLQRR